MISTHSTVRHTRKVSAHESHIFEDNEDFYDVGEYAPSSPFMDEIDTTQMRPLRDATNQSMSPSKLTKPPSSPSKDPLRDDESCLGGFEGTEIYNDKENHSTPSKDPFKSPRYDADETCMSTFSMVTPADMTRFAHLSVSPSKNSTSTNASPVRSHKKSTTPRSGRTGTPPTTRMAGGNFETSPTPRRNLRAGSEQVTTQLLEFTEQFEYAARQSPSRRRAAAATFRSPVRNESANLLDFDMPPAPTPRSLPTITARELESLKAGFVSQISSLRATIDGKEATIKSLIEAKDDAERRVGETAETLRETQDARKALEEEKEEWGRRDEQIAAHLQNVKDELVDREAEATDLRSRLEESEHRVIDAEARAQDTEARLEELRNADGNQSNSTDAHSMQTPTRRTIDQAVENVTRELHQLYKNKHEAKVTALKKSYEKRWESTVRELRATVEELQSENTDLRASRDATMSGVMPSMSARGTGVDAGTDMSPARKRRCVSPVGKDNESENQPPAEDEIAAATLKANEAAGRVRKEVEDISAAHMETLAVKIKLLEDDVIAARSQSEKLREELEMSRAENSDLVAVVEEMLQLDPTAGVSAAVSDPSSTDNGWAENGGEEPALIEQCDAPTVTTAHLRKDSSNEMFCTSTSEHSGAGRPSGLSVPKAAGSSKSGFGFGAGKAAPLNRSVSGGRSGIMSNIERMGRGRGAE